jgi:transcriptional regulator with XRE-family HTH domain
MTALRQIRMRLRLTLQSAATIVGMSRSRLTEIELGAVPTPFNGQAILEAYGIRPTTTNLLKFWPTIYQRHEARYRRESNGQ